MKAWRIAMLLVGSAVAWLGSSMTWVSVSSVDDKAGSRLDELSGSEWAGQSVALTLLLAAAALATFALRRWGRRIVGVIGGLAAAGLLWGPVALLVGGPDLDRAFRLLASQGVPEWAEVTATTTHVAGPLIAAVGACLALVAAVAVVLRPGAGPQAGGRYARLAQRRRRAAEGLAHEPGSERALWDALDADIDPTGEALTFPDDTSSLASEDSHRG